ncbi:MAG: type I-E CRISPR-associated protein Cse2/CasB [Betaproteobacteria bacterium]|nr:type I-E CRISPR-associated protein Cse2/CasB [Betaproteobacteria bacterium]
MARTFEMEHGVGKLLYTWWKGLDDDRASRAILRRAADVTAVTLTAPYQRLYRRLCEAGWSDARRNDALAAAVGLLAHVREGDDNAKSLAASMSTRIEGGDRPRVSKLRFMRLLESPDLEALFTGLRRALPLMNHRVDVLMLANDVVEWGDKVKKNWAYNYEWPA